MENLIRAVRQFRDDREWSQFHNPKDLAISVSLEAAELLEHFQWKTAAEMQAVVQDPSRRHAIGEEMADVLITLITFADTVGLDLLDVARAKLVKNAQHYPVALARGTARKYTELGRASEGATEAPQRHDVAGLRTETRSQVEQ